MSLEGFSKRGRGAIRNRAASETFDLVVIGGGITGASIFRDAALRGMRVALLDAGDFASGTSSRSSKLIHGGLRYLRNLGFRLAGESCRERNLHIRLNRRLVRPIPFLIPIYRDGESKLSLRLGMLAYEALSSFRNAHRHRFLTREGTLLLAPGIPVGGLTGGCLYYDAIVSDSRWTVEVLKDGVRAGGAALSYAPVTGLLKEGGRVAGVIATDGLSGGAFEVRARAVVNATGVFADAIRRLDDPVAPPILSLSKGTHLVFAKADVPLGVTTVFASPIDGRSLFLVKRQGCFLYGTTDDWEESDPGLPTPGERDGAYLLESLARFMPESGLDRGKVQYAYSGFRPLLRGGAPGAPGSASREDHLEWSASGLLSVVGGKLTTARLMAIRVLDGVIARIGPEARFRAGATADLSIGGTNAMIAEGFAEWVRRRPSLAGYFRILFQRYGLDAHAICAEATRIDEGGHEDPRAEPIRAEVQYVCRHEMVCTLEDLMERRAGFLWWSVARRLERLRYGAHLLREELDLSDAEFEGQYEAYREKLARLHTLPGSAS